MATNDKAQLGGSLRLSITSPMDGGKVYAAMAAFNTQFGIPFGARRFPLDLDPLLMLSLSEPAMFQNFVGFLDGNGAALATLHIPNLQSLRGLELVTGYLVLDPSMPTALRGFGNAIHFQVW
jgi:hypothetical protein